MDDVAVGLEHVDLLNRLDGLDIELLQRRLQLLVVHSRALVNLLDLSSRRALSTIDPLVSSSTSSNSLHANHHKHMLRASQAAATFEGRFGHTLVITN